MPYKAFIIMVIIVYKAFIRNASDDAHYRGVPPAGLPHQGLASGARLLRFLGVVLIRVEAQYLTLGPKF